MSPAIAEFDRFLDDHLGGAATFLRTLQHHGVITGDVSPDEKHRLDRQRFAPQRLYVNPVGFEGSHGRLWAYFNVHEQRKRTVEFHGIDIDGVTIRRAYSPAQALQGQPVTAPFAHAVKGRHLWTICYYYFLKLGIIRMRDIHDKHELLQYFRNLAVILGYIELSSDEEDSDDSDISDNIGSAANTITVNPPRSLIVRLPLSVINPQVRALFKLPVQASEPANTEAPAPDGTASPEPETRPTSRASSVVYLTTRDTTAHSHIFDEPRDEPREQPCDPPRDLPRVTPCVHRRSKFDDLFDAEERLEGYPDKINMKRRRCEELQEEIDALTMEADTVQAELHALEKEEADDKVLRKRILDDMTKDEIYEAGALSVKRRRPSV